VRRRGREIEKEIERDKERKRERERKILIEEESTHDYSSLIP
jgi:hypothetical protein